MRKILPAGCALLLAVAVQAAVVDLQTFVEQRRQELWQLDAQGLVRAFPDLLRWNDAAKSELFFARNRAHAIRFAGEPVQELLFFLADGHLAEIRISVYNRGDAPPIKRSELEKRRRELETLLQGWAGKVPRKGNSGSVAGASVSSGYWEGADFTAVMRWSYSKGTPEYLTVTLLPPGTPVEDVRRSVAATVSRAELKDNVITEPDGTRFLAIPMINQGDKGYCAAATIARVMQYYEAEVDQHLIAQLAKSDAAAGTAYTAVLEALDKADSRLKIRTEVLYRGKYFNSVSGLMNYVNLYNRQAKAAKKPQIRFEDFVSRRPEGRVIEANRLFGAMDPAVVKALRLDDKREYAKFRKSVAEEIDRGVPIVWMIPSHMRLINGYNPETDEIIYTDSYGAGHEKKRMRFDDAWSMTMNTLVIVPRRKEEKP